MNRIPYGLAGSLSAKVKGFTSLPRSPNVVMCKDKDGYLVGIMPSSYSNDALRPCKKKRAKLDDVQRFKTENEARVYMDKIFSMM